MIRGFNGEKLCIAISGSAPERFLNIANRRCLELFNICEKDGSFYAFTTAKAFPALCSVAEKTGTELTVISRYGLLYRIRNYKKRAGFWGGFAVFCLTLWLLSQFIWSVEVVNLPEDCQVSVSDLLYDAGIRTGVLCRSIDARVVELELEEQLPQFDMIKVSHIGCNARVQFSAARQVKKLVKEQEPSNLVAAESGQIVSVTALQGIPFVAEGDIVVPGDVLVSGVFSADGDFVSMVRSVGQITALVDRTFSASVDYRQMTTEPTGLVVNINRLMAFGVEIPLFGALPKGNYRRTYEEYPLNLFGFSFPFLLRREQWHELCFTEKEFSREECIAQAETKLDAKIRKTACIEIVSSERTVNETNTGIRVTRFVTLLKDIAEEVPLQVVKNPETDLTG